MYNEKILSLFEKPKNVGIVKCADGMGEAGNVEDGQIVKIYIRVEDEVIKEAKFKAYGGVLTIAGACELTNLIKDYMVDKAKMLTTADLAKSLELDGVNYPELDICIEALITAISEYYKNQLCK